MDKINEWSSQKRWNPFNSYKLLAQVYRWRRIREGQPIPQPSTISVDPINVCNLDCTWCNAKYILKKNHNMISRKMLLELADFFSSWQGSADWEKGVESVCLGGGGESLLNKHTGDFINRCVELGIEVGVVTNGTMINSFIEPLSKCTFVGVSVDAGSSETFMKLKSADYFDVVINNMRELVEYCKANDTRLSKPGQGYGVSYKYLIYPDNVREINQAAGIAKEIGCKNFHMRPVSVPWFDLGKTEEGILGFTPDVIREFNKQTMIARKLEDDDFGVFGITHKFDSKFNVSNQFRRCYAVFMTAVIMPATGQDPDQYSISLCCDRRGDELPLLGDNLGKANEIARLWGSRRHWEIAKSIDVDRCPRCTYQPHNQIFEHVILEDSMTYRFI
jgi:pyruvate-formate lyase-activating enzyme